ncbi:hypothetical protein CLU84_1277 [Comamonas sp. 26]|nr:hypothetical protein CLU84_1277 [Comamonas sp. 26]
MKKSARSFKTLLGLLISMAGLLVIASWLWE